IHTTQLVSATTAHDNKSNWFEFLDYALLRTEKQSVLRFLIEEASHGRSLLRDSTRTDPCMSLDVSYVGCQNEVSTLIRILITSEHEFCE
ncbi:hypothetical protein B296_00053374, partial [Ensete ventricosum]